MFTGIVKEKCPIKLLEKKQDIYRVLLESCLAEAKDWELGDSVALNGACMTIVEKSVKENSVQLQFDISQESLSKTNFQDFLDQDRLVHVEGSLKMGDSLGGHLVTGHVDGLGSVVQLQKNEDTLFVSIEVQNEAYQNIAPYMVKKGSITVNGVSLTVNDLRDHVQEKSTQFDLMLIPHTLQLTHFLSLQLGDKVNLEADILAKHVCRFVQFQKDP